jgi:hypothetical protein
METEWDDPCEDKTKAEVLCHSKCDKIKIPSCSKSIGLYFAAFGNGEVSIYQVNEFSDRI